MAFSSAAAAYGRFLGLTHRRPTLYPQVSPRLSPCKHPISALSCIPIVATPYILGFERTNGYNGTNRVRTTLMAPAAPQKSIFQTY